MAAIGGLKLGVGGRWALTGACRVCGYPLRPGADYCRTCDANYRAAMRKAKLVLPRARKHKKVP
jgi:hypothetical protein